MDGKDILQKYRPVIHEMMRDAMENSIPYITVTACQDYCVALSDGAELTIMNGNERIISASHRVNRRLANNYKEYEEDIKDEA